MNIFTEKLYAVKQENAFPGAKTSSLEFDGQILSPIFPIRADAVRNLDLEDLYKKGIAFEQDEDTITVRVICIDINGKKIDLKKKFDLANDVIMLDQVPVLEIWPNFRTQDWKVYYTFVYSSGKSFQAQPYTRTRSEEAQIKEGKIRIIKTNSFPDAILCNYKKEDAGILIPFKPDIITRLDKHAKIGIDLGTTGVNIYLCSDSIQPIPIHIEPNVTQITDSGDLRVYMYDWFLPTIDIKLPIQNIFHDFKIANRPLRPLLDGHIYYLKNFLEFANEEKLVNVKWSDDPSDRYYFCIFLKQICLQCCAEAVLRGIGEIDWQFSYSDELSLSEKCDLECILNIIIKFCIDLTGVKAKDVFHIAQPKSIALAKFFAENPETNAPVATGTVCLNIDDDNTDIHVWQNNMLIYGSSISISNKTLFFELFEKNLKLLNALDSNDNYKKLEKSKNNYISFFSLLNKVIQDDEQKWMKNMSYYVKEPCVNGFIQIITIGISGLFYYIGLLIRYLIRSSMYKEKGVPSIYLGGKGTHLFHWIANGNYKNTCATSDFLKKSFLSSYKLSDEQDLFKIEISPLPESEIAYGLACSRINLRHSDKKDLFQRGDPEDWNDKLLINDSNVKTNIDHFEDFIKFLKNSKNLPTNLSISEIKLGKDLLNRVYERLNSKTDKTDTMSDLTMSLEPSFIKKLKILLEEKTNDWLSKKV